MWRPIVSDRIPYERAIQILDAEHTAWVEAEAARRSARDAYFAKARANQIRLCDCCAKPMPEYDHSMQCDGCDAPWNWATPKGRREMRAAELDAELARLQAERAKL